MSFTEKIQNKIMDGFKVTRDALSDAAEKAKELGQKGILQFEMKKLDKQIENKLAILGSEVYSLFFEKNQKTISKDTAEINDLLSQINKMEKEIDQKEIEFKAL
jgi:hypothetical protein